MEIRSKVKLILSPLDRKLESGGKILLIAMWALAIYTFWHLPTTIPIHFNAKGLPDGFGRKVSILVLPIIATAIYVGMTMINKHPHNLNYPITITVDNAQKQYTTATRMLRYLKLSIVLIFSFIILFTYLTAIGARSGLGILPMTLGLLISLFIYSIIQSVKK